MTQEGTPPAGPRIGLLGGTFNPPHLGHLVLAECARDELGLDEVRLVLAARPPHKDVEDDPGAEERLALCRAAVAGDEGRLAVSDVELRRDGPSYTADTLEGLHAEQPGASFVLLLGGDAAAGLDSWHRPEDVLRFAAIGVAERGADTHERARETVGRLGYPDRLLPFSMPSLELSSTAIRARVRAGRTIRHLVPAGVEARIDRLGLYRGGRST
ncbi:nicotinate (nicotinamide) nucleotide adenylyltransferase [Patulibacter sp.]|uniref:nicotinate (nicotinamide) nucleotide adenylyltransferase n=1 Tax=Patulibacter sp. TaxID=1912859 RepID=UPI002725D547|nr:nicotinate (nicotinamide) nucleotide adenylyltransferase [Patulibacter sp.]MDO9408411.1 nicotinate (nicotinamide) nucleotide adenylyltransferase [Patulibacter sp.]